MTHKYKQRFDPAESEIVQQKPQIKPKKPDLHSKKGSIDLYSFISDAGINRVRDRVDPSSSIILSKAQRTNQLY
jgi:hypothetical protein